MGCTTIANGVPKFGISGRILKFNNGFVGNVEISPNERDVYNLRGNYLLGFIFMP